MKIIYIDLERIHFLRVLYQIFLIEMVLKTSF